MMRFLAILRFVLLFYWLVMALVWGVIGGDLVAGIWALAWVIVLQTGGE